LNFWLEAILPSLKLRALVYLVCNLWVRSHSKKKFWLCPAFNKMQAQKLRGENPSYFDEVEM